MTANFPDYFKTVRIFPSDCQFSGWFQKCPDFSNCAKNRYFWFRNPFFHMIANFPDYFKTVRIFPDDCQFSGWFQNHPDFQDDCQFSVLTKKPFKLSQYFQIQNDPDFSRWFPIFRIISKLSRFFQMIANFPDDFKTVRILLDADGTPNAANFGKPISV